jgi:transcriptional regulator with XRE-family HTH domain
MSTLQRGTFDAAGFFSAVDAVRLDRQMNWKQVAAESGVSASTLTRLAQGKRPDVDSLAALVDWSGLRVDDYVKRVHEERDVPTLAMISTYLRSDRNLSDEAAIALDEVVKATYERLRKR